MSSYRSLLLELSNGLTTADLQQLKFLCEDVIPVGKLEKFNQGFQLFGALEQLNLLSEKNKDFLASKLIAVNRNDLRNKLLGIQGFPTEERQTFPSLNDLGNAVPSVGLSRYIPPTVGDSCRQPRQQLGLPVCVSTRQAPEQVESTNHSTSSTRVPHPEGNIVTSSQPIAEQVAEPNTVGEMDVRDSAESVPEADAQVDLELKRDLQKDGCFLDPVKYDPVKSLGFGGFATVYLVIEKETGKKIACKMCSVKKNHSDAQKLVKSMETEVVALSLLKHKHILQFLDVQHIRKTVLLFLEYMEGGTLEDLIKAKGPLEEPLVIEFTRQLLSAVDFLHTNGTKHVIHKDIKGNNILLDGAQTNLKLADFGICTIMEELKTSTGGLVTKNNIASFHWTSPELLNGEEFGRNTDIWSVGCTVVEMLTTKPPLFFEKLTNSQKMFRIVKHQVDPPPECSPLACGFLKRCLCEKETRASAAELLTDPFLSIEPLTTAGPV